MNRYLYLFASTFLIFGCASKGSAPVIDLANQNSAPKTAIEKIKKNEVVFSIAVPEIAVRDKSLLISEQNVKSLPKAQAVAPNQSEERVVLKLTLDGSNSNPEITESSLSSIDNRTLEKVETSQVKEVSYQDLVGGSTAIRSHLTKNGFVIQPSKFVSSVAGVGNYNSTIIEQIKKDEFRGATYVLSGILVEISNLSNLEKITGTTNKVSTKGLELTVEFNLYEVESQKIVASFSAFGRGLDRKILDSDSTHDATQANLMQRAHTSLADNVFENLISQGFIPPNTTVNSNEGLVKRRLDEDSSSLKIYK
jgi:hypothetical protein